MKKLLAVIKREYVERVRSKWFIFGTILAPLIMAALAGLPGLFFSIKTGGPTRLAVVDLTPEAKLFVPIRDTLQRGDDWEEEQENPEVRVVTPKQDDQFGKQLRRAMGVQFEVLEEPARGRDLNAVKQSLNNLIAAGALDGYVILPPGLIAGQSAGEAEFFGRNVNDVIARNRIRRAINNAVREQRLSALGVDQKKVAEASRNVTVTAYPVSEKGVAGAEDSGEGFWAVFFLGLLIYMTIIMYGNGVLAAVVEEKGTRVSEILFSSVNSFTLMIGKLIGVSLVGLTQYAIWGAMFVLFTLFGVQAMMARGFDIGANIPHISPLTFLCLILYFLIGYFIYASMYALVGAMVTTVQEGTQMSMPITYVLVISFMVSFAVIRAPNSPMAFWLSMIPLFSPIVMPLRILSAAPPPWELIFSLCLGFGAVAGLIWLTARVYRVGMLMYGKKATLPEVWRWIRQP